MANFSLKQLKGKRFHFIGIGGISMSALAQMLNFWGVYVQGSDIAENDETIKLKQKNIKVFASHDASNLKNIDVVVYTSAIHEDNPELGFAHEHGMEILKRAELLGLVASLYSLVIAVAGSHGKTTTTAMLAEIFLHAKLNPTIHIGGSLNMLNSNYHLGSKEYFITEACEYKDNFLYVAPDIAVSLNIDSDHLDYFGNLDGVKTSFKKFVAGLKKGGISIVSADDPNSKELRKTSGNVSFGFSEYADLRAENDYKWNAGCYAFVPVFMGCELPEVKLNIVGRHNILNALAAILVSLACGIKFSIIKEALENFSGTERRCQIVGKVNGAVVFHDYAHHPCQIESMVKVARDLVQEGGRVITVFEPHTYSRTKFLLAEFAKSFDGCDISIFAPAYSAREDPSEGYEADVLAEATKQYVSDVKFIKTFDEIFAEINKITKPNDVVFILGAGTIEYLAKRFN